MLLFVAELRSPSASKNPQKKLKVEKTMAALMKTEVFVKLKVKEKSKRPSGSVE